MNKQCTYSMHVWDKVGNKLSTGEIVHSSTYFLSLFYLSTQLSCLLTCLSLVQSWIFCVNVHLVFKFPFFVLFRMMWNRITMNKLNYTANISYTITANAGSRFCWISVTVYIRLLQPLLFSIKHIENNVLTHEISN